MQECCMNNPRNIVNTKGYYCATVHGYSMYPLLCNHRDSVYIEKANSYKKYDVVLFERPNGKLVLHRIIKIKNGVYYFCGDNDFVIEKVAEQQFIGKMTEFSRKDKEYTINNFWYKLYTRVWCCSLFTKKILKRIYNLFHKSR